MASREDEDKIFNDPAALEERAAARRHMREQHLAQRIKMKDSFFQRLAHDEKLSSLKVLTDGSQPVKAASKRLFQAVYDH